MNTRLISMSSSALGPSYCNRSLENREASNARLFPPTPKSSIAQLSIDQKSSSGRSESWESDDSVLNCGKISDEKKRSSTGEKRLRSWRTAVMRAKQKAWNALKSSATFHGPLSNTRNSSSGFSTGSELDEICAQNMTNSCASSRIASSHVSSNLCGSKKIVKKLKPPHTASMPMGLCDQTNWNAEYAPKSALLTFNLSERQRQNLRCTWYRIRGNGGLRFAERIFQSLFESAPYVKDIFYKAAFLSAFQTSKRHQSSSPCTSITTCRDHAWIILRLLDSLILDWDEYGHHRNRSESDESIVLRLRRFGAQHAFLAKSAGMRAELWELFGEAAVDIVRRYDCIRSNTDASRAWRILFASITDEIRDGYEKELRKRFSTSTVNGCPIARQGSGTDF